MNPSTRRSPLDRDRAVARLRRLTIGTTIASVAALGGFGAMAAVTYSGGSTGVTTAAAIDTAAIDAADLDATTTTTTTTTTSTDTSSSLQTTTTPTTTSGGAHVTTGGS